MGAKNLLTKGINHLMCKNDIKLFAKNEKEFEQDSHQRN